MPDDDLLFMDFIPFECEPRNENNQIQTKVEHSGGIKKKRPVDDDSGVGTLFFSAFRVNDDAKHLR